MAHKCLICGKYVKGFNACHAKCLNKSDVSLEKILKKGAWAAKKRNINDSPSSLWVNVRAAHRSHMYNGSKPSKERYDKAYDDYKKAGGTRPRPKWYYGA
jgi:hypothetical protein